MPDKDYARIALIVSGLWRVTAAAQQIGIERSTLQTAVRLNHCRSYNTADGLPLVDLDDIAEWNATRTGPGRPPKEKGPAKRAEPKRKTPNRE